MNTRILELLEQARTECSHLGSKPATTVGYDELEKFAQLIEANVIERIMTVGLINERGNLVTFGTSWRINE